MRRALVVVTLLGVLGACSADRATRAGTATTETSACDEVVLGIEAFNAGNLTGTVSHFRKAVPLAEAEAATEDSTSADALVDAVHYYAELPPEDYPAAAATSPDFARYKAITLGLCASDGPTDAPTESQSEETQVV